VSTWRNTDQRAYYIVGGQAILNTAHSQEASETITGPILARVNDYLTKRSVGNRTSTLWLTRGDQIITAIPDRSKFVFAVSAGPIDLTIISGSAVLGDTAEFPRDASRRIGIAIARVQVRSGDEVRELHGSSWLDEGVSRVPMERDAAVSMDDGNGANPPTLLKGLEGPLQLTITLLNQ